MKRYSIIRDGKLIYIKQGSKRLPIEQYKHIRNNPVELSKFVARLNHSVVKTIEIRHAFISPELLDKFQTFLTIQISNKIMAKCYHGYVVRYFLDYFINIEKILDPLEWHRQHKTGWAKYLINLKLAPSTKKQIVYASNKFMKWLKTERPELPEMKFEPISPGRFKQLIAIRKMNKEQRETFFIPEADCNLIVTSAPKNLLPTVQLCLTMGLRRSEALGLKSEDVKNGYLLCERQLLRLEVYGPNKGRLARKIPYWFATPEQIYKWISSSIKIHPRTISKLWDDFIEGLFNQKKIAIKYNLHDLRHTWITRAMRLKVPRDVQLAAGHVNILTTMGYVHDDRNLEDEQFKPAS